MKKALVIIIFPLQVAANPGCASVFLCILVGLIFGLSSELFFNGTTQKFGAWMNIETMIMHHQITVDQGLTTLINNPDGDLCENSQAVEFTKTFSAELNLYNNVGKEWSIIPDQTKPDNHDAGHIYSAAVELIDYNTNSYGISN